MSAYDELRPKQRRFVDEYLHGSNASAAVVRAGYTAKHPEVAGARLMARPAIRTAIADRKREQERRKLCAQVVLHPTVQGSETIQSYGNGMSKLAGNELVGALAEQAKAVMDGDLARGEAMLTVQAHTLDAIFNRLAGSAINQKMMPHLEAFLKLALRAQSQCRATWETIALMKNPPIAGYVKQANIAHGHQQVNNDAAAASRTGDNQNPPNKLLEHSEHEPDKWLDRRTPAAARSADSQMEPVGAIHRTEESRR